ncbi:MAG: nickel-dependent lactate racemase [Bryobacteraceae bacterium]|nr:nickel-dependent lactate racemase [Bryobacteraceae bacterium]MDW8379140.1 nickel-dependent lactate racemase [Bryobacterales bacterium]
MFFLPYGESSLAVRVDGELIRHRDCPPQEDETRAIVEALSHPIASPRLDEIVRPQERVAVIVNDITRLTRSDLMLPPLVQALNAAGIPDRDIFVVFALGIHRPQTPAERRRILGEDLYRRLRCMDHDAFDEANLVEVGVTSFGNRVQINRHVLEADRIVLTGEIIYHLIAGYSGGRKSLVPGVAGARTTTFNHNMIFDPRCRSGRLEGNPAHEDLMEACRLVEPDFLLNVVLDPRGRLVKAVAGHWELAHREGCKAVDAMLRADLEEPFDLLIASAGGYPLDIDLRQAHKGLENAVQALKPGGSIVFYAECRSGSGHPGIDDYLHRFANDQEMEAELRRNFAVGGHKAWWIARLGRLFDVHLVSQLPEDFVRRCHFQPVAPERHQQRVTELAAKARRIGVLPYSGFTLPFLSGKEALAS